MPRIKSKKSSAKAQKVQIDETIIGAWQTTFYRVLVECIVELQPAQSSQLADGSRVTVWPKATLEIFNPANGASGKSVMPVFRALLSLPTTEFRTCKYMVGNEWKFAIQIDGEYLQVLMNGVFCTPFRGIVLLEMPAADSTRISEWVSRIAISKSSDTRMDVSTYLFRSLENKEVSIQVKGRDATEKWS